MASELDKIWNWVKKEFDKVVNNAPADVRALQLTVAGLAPIMEGAVAIEAPAFSPIFNGAVSTAENGLGELSTLMAAYSANPGTSTLTDLQAGFTVVNAQLPEILTVCHVTDPTTQAAIGKVLTKVETVVDSVVSSIVVLESNILAVHTASGLGPQTKPTPIASTGTPVPPAA